MSQSTSTPTYSTMLPTPYQQQPPTLYFTQPQVALAPQSQPSMPHQQLPTGTVVYGYLPPGAIVLPSNNAPSNDAAQPAMQAQHYYPQQQQTFAAPPPPLTGTRNSTHANPPAQPQYQHVTTMLVASTRPAAPTSSVPMHLNRLAADILSFCAHSTGPQFFYQRFTCGGVSMLRTNFMNEFIQPKLLKLDDTRRNTWTFSVRGPNVELTKKISFLLLELQALLSTWLHANRSRAPSPRKSAVLTQLMLRSQGEEAVTPVQGWLKAQAPEVSMHMRDPGAADEHAMHNLSTPLEAARLCVLEWRITTPTARDDHENEQPADGTGESASHWSTASTKYGPIELPSTSAHPCPSKEAMQRMSPKDLYAAIAKSQLPFWPGWGYVKPDGAARGMYLDHVTREAYERLPNVRRMLQRGYVVPERTTERDDCFFPKAEGSSQPPSEPGDLDANDGAHDEVGTEDMGIDRQPCDAA